MNILEESYHLVSVRSLSRTKSYSIGNIIFVKEWDFYRKPPPGLNLKIIHPLLHDIIWSLFFYVRSPTRFSLQLLYVHSEPILYHFSSWFAKVFVLEQKLLSAFSDTSILSKVKTFHQIWLLKSRGLEDKSTHLLESIPNSKCYTSNSWFSLQKVPTLALKNNVLWLLNIENIRAKRHPIW